MSHCTSFFKIKFSIEIVSRSAIFRRMYLTSNSIFWKSGSEARKNLLQTALARSLSSPRIPRSYTSRAHWKRKIHFFSAVFHQQILAPQDWISLTSSDYYWPVARYPTCGVYMTEGIRSPPFPSMPSMQTFPEPKPFN